MGFKLNCRTDKPGKVDTPTQHMASNRRAWSDIQKGWGAIVQVVLWKLPSSEDATSFIWISDTLNKRRACPSVILSLGHTEGVFTTKPYKLRRQSTERHADRVSGHDHNRTWRYRNRFVFVMSNGITFKLANLGLPPSLCSLAQVSIISN